MAIASRALCCWNLHKLSEERHGRFSSFFHPPALVWGSKGWRSEGAGRKQRYLGLQESLRIARLPLTKRSWIKVSAAAGGCNSDVGHVVIVGGGMAGFSLGLALQSRGISFDIYERREGPGLGRGTLQTLWPNGLRALDAIQPGLAGQMREAGQEMKLLQSTTKEGLELLLLNRQDFSEAEKNSGYPALFMHWPQVLEIFEASLPLEKVHYGCTFKSYTETETGIRATFSAASLLDGPPEVVAEGSLLVAADGLFSAVRAAAFGGALLVPGDGISSEARAFASLGGGEAIRDGCRTTWRGIAFGLSLVDSGVTIRATTQGRYCILAGMKEGTYWSLNFEDKATNNKYRMRSKTKMEVYSRIMDAFGDWPYVAEAVNATDMEDIREARILDRPVSADWYEGRVVCKGDAVHPLKPAAGQGSNTALEDSYVLARELARRGQSLQNALFAYEKERKPRLLEIEDFNELLASGAQEDRKKAMARGTGWLWGHQLEDLPAPSCS